MVLRSSYATPLQQQQQQQQQQHHHAKQHQKKKTSINSVGRSVEIGGEFGSSGDQERMERKQQRMVTQHVSFEQQKKTMFVKNNQGFKKLFNAEEHRKQQPQQQQQQQRQQQDAAAAATAAAASATHTNSTSSRPVYSEVMYVLRNHVNRYNHALADDTLRMIREGRCIVRDRIVDGTTLALDSSDPQHHTNTSNSSSNKCTSSISLLDDVVVRPREWISATESLMFGPQMRSRKLRLLRAQLRATIDSSMSMANNNKSKKTNNNNNNGDDDDDDVVDDVVVAAAVKEDKEKQQQQERQEEDVVAAEQEKFSFPAFDTLQQRQPPPPEPTAASTSFNSKEEFSAYMDIMHQYLDSMFAPDELNDGAGDGGCYADTLQFPQRTRVMNAIRGEAGGSAMDWLKTDGTGDAAEDDDMMLAAPSSFLNPLGGSKYAKHAFWDEKMSAEKRKLFERLLMVREQYPLYKQQVAYNLALNIKNMTNTILKLSSFSSLSASDKALTQSELTPVEKIPAGVEKRLAETEDPEEIAALKYMIPLGFTINNLTEMLISESEDLLLSAGIEHGSGSGSGDADVQDNGRDKALASNGQEDLANLLRLLEQQSSKDDAALASTTTSTTHPTQNTADSAKPKNSRTKKRRTQR